MKNQTNLGIIFFPMGVYKKGDNWYIDYYFKGKRKRKKVGPSKKLAMQVLKDVQVKLAKGEYLGVYDEKKITFEDMTRQYLAYSKTNKAASSYNRDRYSIRRLLSAFKGKYIFEITPSMVEKYKAERLKEVTPATINRELSCLKHMYTVAIEWGYLNTNPTKSVKKLKEPPGRLRYLNPSEADALIEACPDHIRSIVVTALNTGMRKGEILNLKWSQIDMENKTIALTDTKNNEARIVPINQTLNRLLVELSQGSNGEYVFSHGNGHPRKDVRTGFNASLEKAGIRDFRFHDLRHTFGSHMVMQGVDLKTVQQIMGHKDIKMTMRYAHLAPRHVQETVQKLDSLWTPGEFSEIEGVKNRNTIGC